MKPKYIVWLEFLSIVTVGALAPLVEILTSDQDWSQLWVSPVPICAGLIGAANAAKAFFSTAANNLNSDMVK